MLSIESTLLYLERTHSETCNARRQSRKAPMPLSKEPYPKIRESPTKSVYTHTHTHTQHTHTRVKRAVPEAPWKPSTPSECVCVLECVLLPHSRMCSLTKPSTPSECVCVCPHTNMFPHTNSRRRERSGLTRVLSFSHSGSPTSKSPSPVCCSCAIPGTETLRAEGAIHHLIYTDNSSVHSTCLNR
jgi:hypothetical protein